MVFRRRTPSAWRLADTARACSTSGVRISSSAKTSSPLSEARVAHQSTEDNPSSIGVGSESSGVLGQVVEGRRPEEGEGAQHVGVQDVERAGDPSLAAGHQPVEVGASDKAGAGAKGDGGDDIGAVTDASVEVDLSAVAYRVQDGG